MWVIKATGENWEVGYYYYSNVMQISGLGSPIPPSFGLKPVWREHASFSEIEFAEMLCNYLNGGEGNRIITRHG